MSESDRHKVNDELQTVPLQRWPDLYLKLDTPKGRGVFSRTPIPSGTVLETSPVLILSRSENEQHIKQTSLYHYTYNWPTTIPDSTSSEHQQATTTKSTTQALVLGLGSMFNHSRQNQNVGWTRDIDRQVIIYRALRDIAIGEELCISYGDHLTFVDVDQADEGGHASVNGDGEVDGILKIEV